MSCIGILGFYIFNNTKVLIALSCIVTGCCYWRKRKFLKYYKEIQDITTFSIDDNVISNEKVLIFGRLKRNEIKYTNDNSNYLYSAYHLQLLERLFCKKIKILSENTIYFNLRDKSLDEQIPFPLGLVYKITKYFLLYAGDIRNQIMIILADIIDYQKNINKNLDNEDTISVYGKLHDDGKSINAEIITQGNKFTVLKHLKREIYFHNSIFYITSINTCLIVLHKLFNWNLQKVIKNSASSSKHFPLLKIEDSCSICRVNIRNIALLNCNHFNLCGECFEKNNRRCNICGDIDRNSDRYRNTLKASDDYIIFRIK